MRSSKWSSCENVSISVSAQAANPPLVRRFCRLTKKTMGSSFQQPQQHRVIERTTQQKDKWQQAMHSVLHREEERAAQCLLLWISPKGRCMSEIDVGDPTIVSYFILRTWCRAVVRRRRFSNTRKNCLKLLHHWRVKCQGVAGCLRVWRWHACALCRTKPHKERGMFYSLHSASDLCR